MQVGSGQPLGGRRSPYIYRYGLKKTLSKQTFFKLLILFGIMGQGWGVGDGGVTQSMHISTGVKLSKEYYLVNCK